MNWKVLPKKSDDLIEQLLINRGIKDSNKFFHPKLSDWEKDLEIPGIPKSAARIQKAIEEDELMIAYGDFDVDGICGAGILYLGLTSLGARVLPYIPHREKEGYGISPQGLEFARDSGASLVITTDTGIVAFNMADYAKKLGLDLIITDHHQTEGSKFPDVFSIVHSTKLCGAGVTWSLVKNLVSKQIAENLLDLVSIATVSDMMSLLGINRALVKQGLEKLNKTGRVGLLALLDEADLKLGSITSYEIGHIIAPRLNAMGRLEHAIDSLRLLCTKDPIKARKLADLVSETNNQRKLLTQEAVDEAKQMVNGSTSVSSSKKIHVLSSKKWIPGIIGLIAGRVCDETGCTTVVISVGEEFSKGSARAGAGVNMVELLRQCGDLLEAVGGHTSAAGFTIKTSKISKFQKRLENLVSVASRNPLEPVLEIEGEIASKELSVDLVKKLGNFEPFGVGNPRPILATMNMVLSDIRTVGGGKHLKGKVDDKDFIAFGMGDLMGQLVYPERSQRVDLAYNLDIDEWDGYEKLQLKVKDLKVI